MNSRTDCLDVTEQAKRASIPYPVAIEIDLWNRLISVSRELGRSGEPLQVRLGKVLAVFWWLAKRKRDACELKFKLKSKNPDETQLVVPICAIFDHHEFGEPGFVLTIDRKAV